MESGVEVLRNHAQPLRGAAAAGSVWGMESADFGSETHVHEACGEAYGEGRSVLAARWSQAGMPPFFQRRRVVRLRAVRPDASVHGSAGTSIAWALR